MFFTFKSHNRRFQAFTCQRIICLSRLISRKCHRDLKFILYLHFKKTQCPQFNFRKITQPVHQATSKPILWVILLISAQNFLNALQDYAARTTYHYISLYKDDYQTLTTGGSMYAGIYLYGHSGMTDSVTYDFSILQSRI